MGADNAAIFSFGDGQGMPGAINWMNEASKRRILSLTSGLGPDCAAVENFDEHGLAAANLLSWANKLGASLRALNQKRGTR